MLIGGIGIADTVRFNQTRVIVPAAARKGWVGCQASAVVRLSKGVAIFDTPRLATFSITGLTAAREKVERCREPLARWCRSWGRLWDRDRRRKPPDLATSHFTSTEIEAASSFWALVFCFVLVPLAEDFLLLFWLTSLGEPFFGLLGSG